MKNRVRRSAAAAWVLARCEAAFRYGDCAYHPYDVDEVFDFGTSECTNQGETQMVKYSSKAVRAREDFNPVEQHQPITSLFKGIDEADRGYRALLDLGYSENEISILMSEETRRTGYPVSVSPDPVVRASESAGIGGAVGGAVGALVGAVIAVGTVVALPGVGLVIAGPIAAGLVGAGAGTLAGGVIGALFGSAIPQEAVAKLDEGLRGGGVLVSVRPRSDDDARRIKNEWASIGGYIA